MAIVGSVGLHRPAAIPCSGLPKWPYERKIHEVGTEHLPGVHVTQSCIGTFQHKTHGHLRSLLFGVLILWRSRAREGATRGSSAQRLSAPRLSITQTGVQQFFKITTPSKLDQQIVTDMEQCSWLDRR